MGSLKNRDQAEDPVAKINYKFTNRQGESRVYGSTNELSDTEAANIEIQKEFYEYGDSEQDIEVPSTYQSTNTPPIKINKHGDV